VKRKVLFVTPEVFPFAKVGGLADVAGSLPLYIAALGHEVKVLSPRYAIVGKEEYALKKACEPFSVPLGSSERACEVFEARLGDSPVAFYFLDHAELYGRDGIYGPTNTASYDNNILRFTLLCRSVFFLCRSLGWIPDIIHSHDWTTALAPVYLKRLENKPPFDRTRSVLTIHNVAHQGIFPKQELHWTGFGWDDFFPAGFEFFDQLNLLKAGILNADMVTTVSPTYAREIQSGPLGWGLEGVLSSRKRDLYGILNGIDYAYWSPETNRRIPAQFGIDSMAGKAKCKEIVQQYFGLPVNRDIPLVGMVGRLVSQKGLTELCAPNFGSLDSICSDLNLQWVILGTGEEWCERELRALAKAHPNLRVELKFEERLAHRIQAGSDFFFMPSKYEPCGLNQMYCMRFGTLPVVRKTGGLADTVRNYDGETGTGFVFEELTPKVLYDMMAWVMRIWGERPAHIRAMRREAMQVRFDWDEAARKYEEVYEKALATNE
jgi:starch synthase